MIRLAFEEHERAHLDAQQALFRVAEPLYTHGTEHELLAAKGWEKPLKALSARLFSEQGLVAKEGSVGVEVSAVLFKIKSDLKLNDKFRKRFRELGETDQSVLRDLIEGLVDDLATSLSKTACPSLTRSSTRGCRRGWSRPTR